MPNPRTKEFPLRHRVCMSFTLQESEATPADFATMLPLFYADQAKTSALAQNIEVNRVNDNYNGISSSSACFMNSRVNKIKLTEYCMVPAAADVPDAMYYKAIMNFGLNDFRIESATGVTLISELKFVENADTLSPLYDAHDLLNGGWFSGDQDGLDTNQHIEHVSLKPRDLMTIRDGVNGPAIRDITAGPMLNRVHKDYPYYNQRWWDVPGKIKRMNAFTGCFLYVGMGEVKTAAAAAIENWFSPHFDTDVTAEESGINFHYMWEFNEYNDDFDQSP